MLNLNWTNDNSDNMAMYHKQNLDFFWLDEDSSLLVKRTFFIV